MFLQPERKGNRGGARLQEHSLSAPPDRFGLIEALRLAVFRAVQENRPVETPCLASDVISLDFVHPVSMTGLGWIGFLSCSG